MEILKPMEPMSEMSSRQKAMMGKAMDSKAAMGMTMMALPPPAVVEKALMPEEKPGEPPPVLLLPLSATVKATAERTSVGKTDDGGFVWQGRIAGSLEPVTLLWWPSGRLTGTIAYGGHVYVIRELGSGMHAIVEMAPDRLPSDHAAMSPATMKRMGLTHDPLVEQGDASTMHPAERRTSAEMEAMRKSAATMDKARPVTISVIVAYTKKAASYYTDIRRDLIDFAIADANSALRMSGIGNVRLALAYAYQTDYVEDGNHFDHVFRFADKHDGAADEVHGLRDKYAADVAILIVDDANGCGLAAKVAASEDRAFAVVHHACAATMHSMAHEIGHLIGARHDVGLDNSTEPFPFGHGFVNGTKWRTMMSYKESCDGCPRLPVWSNPDIVIDGVPTGSAESNNARVIAEQAARVAAFRIGPGDESLLASAGKDNLPHRESEPAADR